MSSSSVSERHSEYQLTSQQVRNFHARYKLLGSRFAEWLEQTAISRGYKKPASNLTASTSRGRKQFPKPPMWSELSSNGKFSEKVYRNQQRLQNNDAYDQSRQAEFLAEKKIPIPQQSLEWLDQSILLREKVHLHNENLPPDKIDPTITWERHQEINSQHEHYIGFLQELRETLLPRPAEVDHATLESEKARRELGKRMRSVLIEMHTMTEDVLEAWKKYREKRLSLSQATLITHAAVDRARSLDRKFLEGETPEEKQLIQKLFADYDPKLLHDTAGKLWLDLDYDLHALLHPSDACPKSDSFDKSMKILHFPTIYVLSNFQGMLESWDNEYPIPGYPVNLEHVVAETPGALVESRYRVPTETAKALRQARLQLKTKYKGQIELIWHFLNEILFLHQHPLNENQQEEFFTIPRGPPGVKHEDDNSDASEGPEKIFLPPDILSKALSDVLRNPGKIAMSTSFAIQLLVEICQGLTGGSGDFAEYEKLSFGKEIGKNVQNRLDDDRNISRNEREPLRSIMNKSCSSGNLLWEQKKAVPNLSYKSKCHFGEDAWPVITMETNKEGTIRTIRNPNSGRIHQVDSFSVSEIKPQDVSWYARDNQFYLNTQPLYAGTLELGRKLADYYAEVEFANDSFSIFVLTHLSQVPTAPKVVNSQISERCKVVTRQQSDWIPQGFQASGAQDVLHLLGPKIREKTNNSGGQESSPPGNQTYEISEESMMKPATPIQSLWEFISQNNPAKNIFIFLSDLETYEKAISPPDRPSTQGEPSRRKGKSKATSSASVKEIAQPRSGGGLSWKKSIAVVENSWKSLPFNDAGCNFVKTTNDCNTFLGGPDLGSKLARYPNESLKNFHIRVLYRTLKAWAGLPVQDTQGQENEQLSVEGESSKQQDENEVEEESGAASTRDTKRRQQAREKKKRNKANKKRRAEEVASRAHLSRSVKRRRL